jgi:hypothetical protein
MNNDSYKGEYMCMKDEYENGVCDSEYDSFLKNLSESWLLLLYLAAMAGITGETMQKHIKKVDEKVKEYADWCPARKTECGTGTTYQICMKTGEICDGCKSQFEGRRFDQEFHFDK